MRITSLKNPLVQRMRDAAHGVDPEHMVADGVTPVRDALRAGCALLEVATAPALEDSERGRALREELARQDVVRHDCADAVLARMSHLTTHQGVIARLTRPRWGDADLLGKGTRPPLLLVAAGIKDPGNLGALVRTAEAAGATGMLALCGGADPFRDKAVRGSSGSIFRLPVRCLDAAEAAAWLRQVDIPHRVAVADADAPAHDDLDLRGPLALVLGGETGGIAAELQESAVGSIGIRMAAAVDSLNVAVAAGVLLFEARRQRG